METSNVHTQNLIEKITEHFYGSQLNNPLDKSKMQDHIASILNKASAAVPPLSTLARQSSYSSAFDFPDTSIYSSSSMDDTPSSSPVPFEDRSSSPIYSSDDEIDSFSFPPQVYAPSILPDITSDLFEKRFDRVDGIVENESDIFFANPAFGMLNFNLPMTPPFTAIRPLSRYSSREACPVIAPLNFNLSSLQDTPPITIINSDISVKNDTTPSEPSNIPPPPPSHPRSGKHMEKFSDAGISDIKHAIYNMLVDNFNSPSQYNLVIPIALEVYPGIVKQGFQFNEDENPNKRISELYAKHIRNADLRLENQNSVFIQDLYKFYLRACMELLSKYFVKHDKYTFLYDDTILFVPGGSLAEAQNRISRMATLQRSKKRSNANAASTMTRGKRAAPIETTPSRRSKRSKA